MNGINRHARATKEARAGCLNVRTSGMVRSFELLRSSDRRRDRLEVRLRLRGADFLDRPRLRALRQVLRDRQDVVVDEMVADRLGPVDAGRQAEVFKRVEHQLLLALPIEGAGAELAVTVEVFERAD